MSVYINTHKINCISLILGLIGLVLFFTVINPLVIYDGDDWYHLGFMRYPFPYLKAYNPIKVFPEIAMPSVGYLAAYVLSPLGIGYVSAVSFLSGLLLSSFILYALVLMSEYVTKIVEMNDDENWIFGTIALLLSFIVFKKYPENNIFLFSATNLTCVYHYVLPSLLNIICVLYMMKHNDFIGWYKRQNYYKQGFFCLMLYLAIFSNVLCSVVSATYAFWKIVFSINSAKGNILMKIKESVKINLLLYGVTISWLFSLLMEACGPRASDVGNKGSLLKLPILEAGKAIIMPLRDVSIFFIIFCGITVLVFICNYAYKRKERYFAKVWNQILQIGLYIFSIGAYIILVSAKAGPGYASRIEVQSGMWLLLLTALMLLSGAILKSFPCIRILVPGIIVGLLILAGNSNKHFRYSTINNVNPSICSIISNDLLKQITQADTLGEKSMILHVPQGDKRDNWPHPKYMGGNISKTLYSQGLISKKMKISIEVDPEMTKIVR